MWRLKDGMLGTSLRKFLKIFIFLLYIYIYITSIHLALYRYNILFLQEFEPRTFHTLIPFTTLEPIFKEFFIKDPWLLLILLEFGPV